MQLILDSRGLQLQKKGSLFEIISEKGSRSISPGKLTSIAITASVVLHTDAIVLAIKHGVPILFFDRIGKARARLWSPYFESIATLRRQQVHFAESTAAASWMVDLLLLKTDHQVANLRYLAGKSKRGRGDTQSVADLLRQQARQLEGFRELLLEECRSGLLGTEGAMARLYWQALGSALPPAYAFQKRSRQPAEDVFNAALNYCYGMLYAVVEGALFAAGLDPHLGLLHADEYRKPTLSYDLIEPFRPWVDRILIDECLEERLQASFFTRNQHGLYLNKAGKAFLIPLFNGFLRQESANFGRKSTTRNHIYYLAGLLAQRIRHQQEG